MTKVLVIGYGNTLRGDDAAGIRAAELIAKRHPEIEYVCMHQLMPELAEQIAVSDIVIFFDADVNVTQPNVRLAVPRVEDDQPRTHFISPESLLRLSQLLYQRMPLKAYVIGIPASQFEFSEELSATTKKAVEESVILAESLLRSGNSKH
jgi:hydrogenase maturation protease